MKTDDNFIMPFFVIPFFCHSHESGNLLWLQNPGFVSLKMRIQAGVWIRELKKNECLSEEKLQRQTTEEFHYKKRSFVRIVKESLRMTTFSILQNP